MKVTLLRVKHSHLITSIKLSHFHAPLYAREGLGENEVEWAGKAEHTKLEFLAIAEACKAMSELFKAYKNHRGFTSKWWECCGLCLWHKPAELAHSFSFCCCVYFCLYGSFDCFSFHKFSRQLFAVSFCSSCLISAVLVLLSIYLFMKVSLGPDIIPRGWLGSKLQLVQAYQRETLTAFRSYGTSTTVGEHEKRREGVTWERKKEEEISRDSEKKK